MTFETRIRKWGNSYGFLIKKEEMKKRNLHENEKIIVNIKKRKNLEELFGLCHFKKPVKEIMREIKKGYDD
ncbi:hypothetical protein CL617_01210 [archaeon]|jgi:antitoxin component of MazEF toxin-antitoxin module|nr:hypothetical protein [archaeon]|tara:strand:- start:2452 stop:2664 length:213 start_codon:yes stop_codon:yes gene_type:complete